MMHGPKLKSMQDCLEPSSNSRRMEILEAHADLRRFNQGK